MGEGLRKKSSLIISIHLLELVAILIALIMMMIATTTYRAVHFKAI